MFETNRFTLGNCVPWPKEAAEMVSPDNAASSIGY